MARAASNSHGTVKQYPSKWPELQAIPPMDGLSKYIPQLPELQATLPMDGLSSFCNVHVYYIL